MSTRVGPVLGLLLAVATATLALASPTMAQPAATPTVSPPTPVEQSDARRDVMGIVAVLLAGVVLITAVAKAVDRANRHAADAVRLQVQADGVLQRDARLAVLPVAVTAHVPYWRESRAKLEVHGRVPTPEAREAVIRVLRRELPLDAVEVSDHLTVLPSVTRRSA